MKYINTFMAVAALMTASPVFEVAYAAKTGTLTDDSKTASWVLTCLGETAGTSTVKDTLNASANQGAVNLAVITDATFPVVKGTLKWDRSGAEDDATPSGASSTPGVGSYLVTVSRASNPATVDDDSYSVTGGCSGGSVVSFK